MTRPKFIAYNTIFSDIPEWDHEVLFSLERSLYGESKTHINLTIDLILKVLMQFKASTDKLQIDQFTHLTLTSFH